MGFKKHIDIDSRVTQVKVWLIEGYSYSDILKKSKNWKVSNRTIDRYVKRAKDGFLAAASVGLEEKRAFRVAQLNEQIKNLKPQYKGTPTGIAAVARIIRQIKDLEGLAAPVRHELAGRDGQPIQLESKTAHTVDSAQLSTAALDEILNARVKK